MTQDSSARTATLWAVEYEGEECYTGWVVRKYRYPERRWRQCSIGYHGECTRNDMDPVDVGENDCQCPRHSQDEIIDAALKLAKGCE